MIDMTYDPEADAAYIYIGRGEINHTEEAGPFIYDVDAEGRVIGIEVLSVSKVLAPGEWQNARLPETGQTRRNSWRHASWNKCRPEDNAAKIRFSGTEVLESA